MLLESRRTTLGLVAVSVLLIITIFVLTGMHNAQLRAQAEAFNAQLTAITAEHNAQLAKQAEAFSARLKSETEEHNAQLGARAAGLQRNVR